MSDDFYKYGVMLGTYRVGVVRAMERIAAGIRDAQRAAQAERTDPLVAYERSRERVYMVEKHWHDSDAPLAGNVVRIVSGGVQ